MLNTFKSIYQTTNFEVKRQICINNIKIVDRLLNQESGLSLRTNQYFELIKLKRRFQSQLKDVENTIRKRGINQFDLPLGKF